LELVIKTLAVKIEDNFMQDFLAIIEHYGDKNLEYDPYFYERQKELHQIRTDIKNSENKLISFDDFEQRTDQLEKEFELKYANI